MKIPLCIVRSNMLIITNNWDVEQVRKVFFLNAVTYLVTLHRWIFRLNQAILDQNKAKI